MLFFVSCKIDGNHKNHRTYHEQDCLLKSQVIIVGLNRRINRRRHGLSLTGNIAGKHHRCAEFAHCSRKCQDRSCQNSESSIGTNCKRN